MSKHEEILRYIEGLSIGSKISVRTIANELDVSDGTAYRAIKDAELSRIVRTVPRVGTVRIEKLQKKNIEHLTFTEVVNIVDGVVLGGKNGLYKTLKKFVIGAMTINEMTKYITPGNLVIVGNREEVHMLALKLNCGVLITGGFSCSESVRSFANEKQLPIISSPYDTFTTATMINKAISENLIKKEIIVVEDIMNPSPVFANQSTTIGRLRQIARENKMEILPLVDDKMTLCGIVPIQNIPEDACENDSLWEYVIKNPITVSEKTTVSYVAHTMAWENIDFIPVIEKKKLVGTIGRQEVIKALQMASRQPQVSDTVDDMLLKSFSYVQTDNGLIFKGKIMPEMLSYLGTASWNAINLIMSSAGTTTLLQKNRLNAAVDSFTVFYTKPIQVDTDVVIECCVIDTGRSFAKVEIEMLTEHRRELLGKAILSAKFLRR